jgi:NAD+ diphosphatase
MFHCEYQEDTPEVQDYVLIFDDDKVLLREEAEGELTIPRLADVPAGALPPEVSPESHRYLFSVDEDKFFCVDLTQVQNDTLTTQGDFVWKEAFLFRQLEPMWMSFAGITAHQLYLWYRGNRFCGRCGSDMTHDASERLLKCPTCGEAVYPKISPVVIVAVTDGDRLLLTRYANGPYTRYALVAGFVEIGEAFEDAVRREVLEETGVHITNIRYYKSQPWGFSSSLLAGYVCDLDGDPAITIDDKELAEAVWLKRSDIPETEGTIALTAEMIEKFRANALSTSC